MPVRPDGRNQREESFRRVGSWSQQVFRQDGDASPSRWAKSARRKFPPSGILVSTSFSTRWGCQSVPMGEISEKKVSAEWDLGLNKFFDKMGMPVRPDGRNQREESFRRVGSWSQQVFRQDGDASQKFSTESQRAGHCSSPCQLMAAVC